MAALYIDPVIMTSPADPDLYTCGTGFLFRPGDRTFLVTNAHVINDGHIATLEEYGVAEFRFGERTFTPKIVAIDPDPHVDLAVIDVDGIEFEKRDPGYWGSTVGSLTAYVPPAWPLASPTVGEATLCVGWPKKFRKHEEHGTEFAAFPMLGLRIGDVTERGLLIPFDRTEMISSDFDPANQIVNETELGGISGSPVFALHRDGVMPLQLVGVVRRYGEAFDVLLCTRADLIRADGSISTVDQRS